MSNPSTVTLQIPTAVITGIAASQSLAAAGALVLNGSLTTGGTANLVTAQRVFINSGGNDSTLVWTISGTNRSNAPISEQLTGGSGAPVNSVLDYLTVTSIVGSKATASTVTAGTGGVGSSEWVLDNFLNPAWYLSVAVQASGTVNYTVEHTYDDPNALPVNPDPILAQYSMEAGSSYPPVVWTNSSLTNQTANGEAQYANQPIMAHRVTINSGSGSVKMWTMQAGIGSP
jgi:hypothetical protein